MLSSKLQASSVSGAAGQRAAAPSPLRAPLRAPVLCRAAPAEEEPRMEDSGFINKDSAGQSNMYPVITRAYEAKVTDITLPNAAILLGAAGAAGAAIFFGLNAVTTTSGAPPPEVAELAQYLSLAEYAARFAAQA